MERITCTCSFEDAEGLQKAEECLYTSGLGCELDDHTMIADIDNFGAKLACEHGYRVEVLVPVAESLGGRERGRSGGGGGGVGMVMIGIGAVFKVACNDGFAVEF
jgi:hypothetical protein